MHFSVWRRTEASYASTFVLFYLRDFVTLSELHHQGSSCPCYFSHLAHAFALLCQTEQITSVFMSKPLCWIFFDHYTNQQWPYKPFQ